MQARILEWVAFPFSRGSSQPRGWTRVSRTAGRFFTAEPQGWGCQCTTSPAGTWVSSCVSWLGPPSSTLTCYPWPQLQAKGTGGLSHCPDDWSWDGLKIEVTVLDGRIIGRVPGGRRWASNPPLPGQPHVPGASGGHLEPPVGSPTPTRASCRRSGKGLSVRPNLFPLGVCFSVHRSANWSWNERRHWSAPGTYTDFVQKNSARGAERRQHRVSS